MDLQMLRKAATVYDILTVWSDPVVFGGVVLGAFMSIYHEMLLTESSLAVLASKWQEIDQITSRVRALLANSQQF